MSEESIYQCITDNPAYQASKARIYNLCRDYADALRKSSYIIECSSIESESEPEKSGLFIDAADVNTQQRKRLYFIFNSIDTKNGLNPSGSCYIKEAYRHSGLGCPVPQQVSIDDNTAIKQSILRFIKHLET